MRKAFLASIDGRYFACMRNVHYVMVVRMPSVIRNMFGVKLAYYQKKDWKRFVNTIDDRESMHDTWHDWHRAYKKTRLGLIEQGFKVVDVVVDLDELEEDCKLRSIKNDVRARSRFVQAK